MTGILLCVNIFFQNEIAGIVQCLMMLNSVFLLALLGRAETDTAAELPGAPENAAEDSL